MADLIATCPVCPGEPVKFIACTEDGAIEIDAEAFGPWRVHPRIPIGPDAPLSDEAWTVSYVNGLGMARALAFLLDDVISQDDARTVAKALADDSRLSGVDGGPIAKCEEIVREVVDMACFRIRCHREFARIDGGDPGDEPDAPLHGECAAEIATLRADLAASQREVERLRALLRDVRDERAFISIGLAEQIDEELEP